MLLRFCYKMDYGDRMPIVSLGQGQGPYAEQLIQTGCSTGDWVRTICTSSTSAIYKILQLVRTIYTINVGT